MPHVRLLFMGFGNVGKALARLLLRKQERLLRDHNLTFSVTGISTGRHGCVIDPRGINLETVLDRLDKGQPIESLSKIAHPGSGIDFIRACPGDVLLETTPVNIENGQPAIDHIKTALGCGMHAITANKGPVVHAYNDLLQEARQAGKRFLFESTMMDGAPIFSLFRNPLPAVDVLGFRGILNSTTNLILGRMEAGDDFEDAVGYAQSIGIAETDPRADIDGWDAAIKVAALVTVIMNIPMKPQDVDRMGIGNITSEMIRQADGVGKRWKLVCSASKQGEGVVGRVTPELIGPDSPLFSIDGTSSYVQFETDVLPGLGIVEGHPTPDTTAYGMLADLINAVRGG